MLIKAIDGHQPAIHPDAYLAETAAVIGEVTLAAGSSVWYSAVIRGDYQPITVGENTCVEDHVMLHGTVKLGKNCIIGHGAILHTCTVEDGSLIGMGATVLDGSVVGAGSIVAAGSLVHHSLNIPAGSMVMGSPAVVVRPLRPDETEHIAEGVAGYLDFAQKQLLRFGDTI